MKVIRIVNNHDVRVDVVTVESEAPTADTLSEFTRCKNREEALIVAGQIAAEIARNIVAGDLPVCIKNT